MLTWRNPAERRHLCLSITSLSLLSQTIARSPCQSVSWFIYQPIGWRKEDEEEEVSSAPSLCRGILRKLLKCCSEETWFHQLGSRKKKRLNGGKSSVPGQVSINPLTSRRDLKAVVLFNKTKPKTWQMHILTLVHKDVWSCWWRYRITKVIRFHPLRTVNLVRGSGSSYGSLAGRTEATSGPVYIMNAWLE